MRNRAKSPKEQDFDELFERAIAKGLSKRELCLLALFEQYNYYEMGIKLVHADQPPTREERKA